MVEKPHGSARGLGVALVIALTALLQACDPWDSGGAHAASIGGDGGNGDDAGGPVLVAPANPDAASGDAHTATEQDAGPGDCGECAPIDACHTASCVDNACVEEVVEDGVPCSADESFVCVAGTCVERGCGDGYREPGPAPAREGCDDGNDLDDDACAGCVPRAYAIASVPDGWDETGAPSFAAAGTDGDGRTLVVWLSMVGGDEPSFELRARRFDPFGAPEDPADAPLVLATGIPFGWLPDPEVAGLARGGWVVAWLAPDDHGRGVYTRVAPDGSLLPTRRVSTIDEDESDIRIAPLLDGFVIAWAATSASSASRVRARRFAATGAPLDAPLTVAEGPGPRGGPSIASSGSRWLAAWEEDGGRVLARRYGGAVGAAATLELAPAASSSPAITTLADGDWAVAWTSRELDPSGDVRARRVRSTGEALAKSVVIDVAATPDRVERAPDIAPVGGDAYVVAWEEGAGELGAFAYVGLLGVPPEAGEVSSALSAAGFRGGMSVAPSSRGTWFVWSARAGASHPAALRSVLAFSLPPE